MDIVLIVLGVAIVGLLVYQNFVRKAPSIETENREKLEHEKTVMLEELTRLKIEMERRNTDFGKIQNELDLTKSERDKFSGKNKELFVQTKDLQNDIKHIREESEQLKKQLAEFQAREKQKESEFAEKLKKLEHAQKTLEDEKQRVRREDEEHQKMLQEQKTKIWNEHENVVISSLKVSCQKPEIGFRFFENTQLPPEFTGSFKPDFLVEFLGQYIYFDAKFSAQKDPNVYFSLDRLSKISKKCKENNVYSTVFFVVPENRMHEIRNFSFRDDGFSFFIISPAAIEPILANFKKITEYENLEKFDPEDREKIITLIANYDRHISFQNAANILLAKESVDLMHRQEGLPENFQSEIAIRKQSMRNFKLKDADLKKLSQNLDEQQKSVEKLTSPRVAVEKSDLESVQENLQI